MVIKEIAFSLTLGTLLQCVPVESASATVKRIDQVIDFASNMALRMFGANSDRLAKAVNKLQTSVPEDVRFPCKTRGFRSRTPPTSIHKLRPGDIDVVAAIGDSMLAGTGAISQNIATASVQNVGFSFGIGGNGNWRQYLTLPNIVKEFNPNLIGQCVGDQVKQEHSDCLNSATGLAVDDLMVDYAKFIVKKMKADPRVDIEKHWKLVTILAGGNNVFLKACFGYENMSTPAHHKQSLQDALDYLQKHLPRTLVNLIGLSDMTSIRNYDPLPFRCFAFRFMSCPSAFYPATKQDERLWPDLVRQYQEEEIALVSSGRYDSKDDFTVVLQPFFTKIEIPKKENGETDYSYIAFDCLHLSQKGHREIAQSLWNNMLEPVGKKSVGAMTNKLICPTEKAPYIFTRLNSKAFLEKGRQ